MKGLYKFKGGADATKRKLVWKWTTGTIAAGDFGDPTTTTSYALCLYANSTLAAQGVVPPAGTCGTAPCWASSSSGFSFKDSLGANAGIAKITLKSGSGTAKILVKGKGSHLNSPLPIPANADVVIQLVKNPGAGPQCWSTDFTAPASKNDATHFKDTF